MRVLISAQDSLYYDQVSQFYEAMYDADVFSSSEFDTETNIDIAIIEVLKSDPDPTTILTKFKSSNPESAVILLTNRTESDCDFSELKGKNNLQQTFEKEEFLRLMSEVTDKLIKKGNIAQPKFLAQFGVLKVDQFEEEKILDFDVYIRITDQKFLKFFSKGQSIGKAGLGKIKNKNLTKLFVKKIDLNKFMENRLIDISQRLESNSNPSASFDEVSKFHMMIHTNILEFGFSEEIYDLVRKTNQISIEIIKKSPKIYELIREKIFDKNESYISWHSNLLTFLTCLAAQEFNWVSDQVLSKLSLASFLHDITITNDKIAHFKTIEEIYESDSANEFSKEEILEYSNHPMDALKLINEIDDFPPDVGAILMQHHENPGGSGFPTGIHGNQITQLASLFIVCHELIYYIDSIDFPLERDLDMFFKATKNKFLSGNFKKSLEALQKGLKKK